MRLWQRLLVDIEHHNNKSKIALAYRLNSRDFRIDRMYRKSGSLNFGHFTRISFFFTLLDAYILVNSISCALAKGMCFPTNYCTFITVNIWIHNSADYVVLCRPLNSEPVKVIHLAEYRNFVLTTWRRPSVSTLCLMEPAYCKRQISYTLWWSLCRSCIIHPSSGTVLRRYVVFWQIKLVQWVRIISKCLCQIIFSYVNKYIGFNWYALSQTRLVRWSSRI